MDLGFTNIYFKCYVFTNNEVVPLLGIKNENIVIDFIS